VGLSRNRSCVDQIASLHIIVEQSLEWNSPLYINFIDHEKAFDSVDGETLWKLMRNYGVLTHLPRNELQNHPRRPAFEVKTGERQSCLLLAFLFLLVIDWIMKTTKTGRNNGI
jgi:hypothetical protein